jgi:hypothetical protein
VKKSRYKIIDGNQVAKCDFIASVGTKGRGRLGRSAARKAAAQQWKEIK